MQYLIYHGLILLIFLGANATPSPFINYTMPGDIMIAGLFDAHVPAADHDWNRCTDTIRPSAAILSEAHVFAVQHFNQLYFTKMKFKVGTWLVDSCASEPLAIQRSLSLMNCQNLCDPDEDRWRGPVDNETSIEGSEDTRLTKLHGPSHVCSSETIKRTVAISGSFSSTIANVVSMLVRVCPSLFCALVPQGFCIPLVAMTSTSAELDYERQYPLFMRTCASDHYHAHVVCDVLKQMKWTRVSVIYENTAYGYGMKQAFEDVRLRHFGSNICVDHYLDVTDKQWDSLISRLEHSANEARVIIVLAHHTTAIPLIQHLQQLDDQRVQLIWPTGGDFNVEESLHSTMEGTIATHIGVKPLEMFRERMIDTHKHEPMSPYYRQLVEQTNECCYSHKPTTPSPSVVEPIFPGDVQDHGDDDARVEEETSTCQFHRSCESVKDGMKKFYEGTFADSMLAESQQVFDAVHIIFKAIVELHQQDCGEHSTVFCDKLKGSLTGPRLYAQINSAAINSTFDPPLSRRQFYEGSYSAEPLYNVSQLISGQWSPIGFYGGANDKSTGSSLNSRIWNDDSSETSPDDGGPLPYDNGANIVLHLDTSSIHNMSWWDNVTASQEECNPNCLSRYGVSNMVSQCCWICTLCTAEHNPYTVMRVHGNLKEEHVKNTCEKCPIKTVPNVERTNCTVAQVGNGLLSSGVSAIVVMVVGVVCCLLSIISTVLLIRHYKTPLLRASTRGLLICLSAMLPLVFGSSLLMIPSEDPNLCVSAWTISSLLLAICHALVLVRCLRFARPKWFVKYHTMLTKGKRTEAVCRRLHCLPSLLFVLGLACAQGLAILIWLYSSYPEIRIDELGDGTEGYYWWCTANEDASTLILMTCPATYMIATFHYLRLGLRSLYEYPVWQTRFGLAGWLCFTITYLTMLPLFFLLPENEGVNVTLKTTFFLSISVITGLIFWVSNIFPVVYMIVARDELNTEEYINRRRSHHFRRGNTVYFIDSYTIPTAKGTKQLVSQFSIEVDADHPEKGGRGRARARLLDRHQSMKVPVINEESRRSSTTGSDEMLIDGTSERDVIYSSDEEDRADTMTTNYESEDSQKY